MPTDELVNRTITPMYTTFDVSTESGVSHLRLTRAAQMNSMTKEFWNEFPQAVRTIDMDGKARVLVISSKGAHFSSGMDLSVFETGDNLNTKTAMDRNNLRRLILVLQEAFSILETSRIPVIAAVQGACIGGAFDMVCACDIRLATKDAFFRIHEINLGMMADLGVLQRLPRLMPLGVVRELAFTGEPLPAERAKSLGLVNEIFETHEEVVTAALKMARKIAEHSPLAVAASKEALNYSRDHSVDDSLKHCINLQSAIFNTAEVMECLKARKEKRSPVFQDLQPIRVDL